MEKIFKNQIGKKILIHFKQSHDWSAAPIDATFHGLSGGFIVFIENGDDCSMLAMNIENIDCFYFCDET